VKTGVPFETIQRDRRWPCEAGEEYR